MVTLSLAQAEDKALALFSAGGLITFLISYLQVSTDPRLQAVGSFLVAVGVLLKAVITTPTPPVQTSTRQVPAA